MLPLLLGLALSATAEKPRLVVLELQPGVGVDASLTQPLTDALTAEVQRAAYFEVISSRDIQTLLGLERQRQLLGCADDAKSACVAELSGAIGARFVLSGSLARLGEAWQLTLNTLDTQRAQPLGRSTRIARSLEALRALLPLASAEATGTPLPPAPPRTLQWSLVGVGSAAAVFGLVWGGLHLAQQQDLAARLDAAGNTGGLLLSRAEYQRQLTGLQVNEAIALGALLLGLASLTTGLLTMPSESPATSVAVVPLGNGLGFAGVFP